VTYLHFDTLYTVINVPYAALTAELTQEYDERSSLAGWRMATAILASLVAATTFKYLAENVIGEWLAATVGLQRAIRLGYAVASGLLAFTLAVPPLILFKVIREPERAPAPRPALNLVRTFREVFASRSFRIVSLVYLLSFGTVDIVVSVLVWFLVYYVRVESGFDSLVLGVVMGLGFATIPLTVKAMQRYGKRTTYIAAMSVFAVVLLILSQAPPGGQGYVLAAAAFAGLGYGAANVVPWAMVADIAEEDELRSGQRREGVYAGYLVFFRKLATAFSLFLVTRVLAWANFQTSTTGGLVFIEQPPRALSALRFLVGVLPALMLALSIIVIRRYPLDKATHDAIRRELAARRAQRPGEPD
jgi:GPH family glycoside/pentoside/hexuronide:cation symporter